MFLLSVFGHGHTVGMTMRVVFWWFLQGRELPAHRLGSEWICWKVLSVRLTFSHPSAASEA